MNRIADTLPSTAASPLDRLLRRRLLDTLVGLQGGVIVLSDACGTSVVGDAAAAGPRIDVHVEDMRFYRLAAASGSVGAGEAYIEGYWRCSDLVALVRLQADGTSLYGFLHQRLFLSWADPYLASLLFALAYMLACWLVADAMDRRGIYIRL